MQPNKPVVLVVDDDPVNLDILVQTLEQDYFLIIAKNGKRALDLAFSHHPDLILLDILMPEMDGFEVCQRLKADKETEGIPVIFLSVMESPGQKHRGFEVGGVDYVTKPFSMPILLEKIRAVLRRSAGAEPDNRLRYRDLAIDPDTREAVLDGRVLDLTTREFDLLYTFLHAPGRVFTREMLLARLWGYDFYGDERVVDSHIKNLRHKLGRNYIETVRGVGYRAAKPDP